MTYAGTCPDYIGWIITSMSEGSIFPIGISIAGYRSFGPDLTTITPLRRLNFIVGQNNSGKSNIIRALTVVSSIFGREPRYKLRSSDFNRPNSTFTLVLHFPIGLLKEKFSARSGGDRDVRSAIDSLDSLTDFPYPFSVRADGNLEFNDRDIELFVEAIKLNDQQLRALSLHVAGSAGAQRHNAENILRAHPRSLDS